MAKHILVIDDDIHIGDLLREAAPRDGTALTFRGLRLTARC